MFIRNLLRVFISFCAFLALSCVQCLASTDYVTIILPKEVVKQSITSILPISVKPDEAYLDGDLVLQSIDSFSLGENSANAHGVVLGRNLALTTRIGNQDFKVKLGSLRLPLTCDFTFRFDPHRKQLFITPHFNQTASSGQAGQVLSALNVLNNKEYPISFDSMKSFQTRIGDQDVNVEMEPVDIRVTHGRIVLQMAPKTSRVN